MLINKGYVRKERILGIDEDEEREKMTNERRVQANRRNALLSTGSKTPEGKAVSAQNARKHGLLSCEVLLPGEDEEALSLRLSSGFPPVFSSLLSYSQKLRQWVVILWLATNDEKW
jgi:hypothetical protein